MNNSSKHYTGRSGGSYGGNTKINTVYTEQESEDQTVAYGFYTYDGYLLSYGANTKTEERDMTKIASTTGNIYGVYDMSGGQWEYVMGVFANSDGELWSGISLEYNSGFKGKVGNEGNEGTLIAGLEWPEEKYYSVYKASSGVTMDRTKACNGDICYGEALTETQGWYGDYTAFVYPTAPWLMRGSGAGVKDKAGGVFSTASLNGTSAPSYATRITLTPAT